MSYADRPGYGTVEPVVSSPVAEYHDRVRWGPIIAGLVTAISLQLVLSALGAAVGLSSLADESRPTATADEVGIAVGIWSIISILISLFVGGYALARACGPMNRSTAVLNGAILWGTTLAISAWLVSSGVTGTFGVILSNLGSAAGQVLEQGGTDIPTNVPNPNVSPGQIRSTAESAADAGWWFSLGALLSLVAAMIGAATGARKHRSNS